MKPADSEKGHGMSRAAKKRAKKKEKNKQKPLETESVQPGIGGSQKRQLAPEKEDNGTNNEKQPGGILKKPKYVVSEKVINDNQVHPDGDPDDHDGAIEMDGVMLGEDFRKLLRSDDIKLKDILLVEEKNKKNTEKEMDKKNPFEELTAKERARAALSFLLAPADLSAEDFYEEYWEKKALCVQAEVGSGSHRHRLDGFLSLKNIRQMTEKHTLHYGKDLNVTRYHSVGPGEPKRRANIDPPPYVDTKTGETKYVEVDSDFVWSQFEENSATIRLLCPHKHNDSVHALLSLFESEWGCMVGANAYLTPKGASQGFAPHYDDIEAFCLQLEGRKRWKVYAPKKEERLPRLSSEDFTEDDMRDREPVLDVVLEPGDFLYMPRGWIHQGVTLPPSQGNEHSLHLTMSAMQQWAWVDYLEMLMPEALEAAAASETSVSLRSGLPRNFLDYMGAMHDQRDDSLPEQLRDGAEFIKEKTGDDGSATVDKGEADGQSLEEKEKRKRIIQLQENFRYEAKKRIMRVAKEAMEMVDAACDQMGKRFLSDRLPPALTKQELACTNEGQKDAKIWPTTMCRLARPGIARLVLEDGKAVLYHSADNSRVYHEVPLSPMEFEVDDAPALEQLITTVEPHWMPVSELIHEGMEDKIAITQALYDEGILSIVNLEGDP